MFVSSSSGNKEAPLKKKFKCKICDKEFLDEKTCEWHSSFCSENLKTQEVLETFLNSADSWQCSFCGKKFENDQIYLSHSTSCNKTLKVQVDSGSKTSATEIEPFKIVHVPTDSNRNISTAEAELFRCEFCGREFPKKGNWKRHVNFCNQTFEAQKIVEEMLKLNKKIFECQFCHKKYANETDYINHSASCSSNSESLIAVEELLKLGQS
ncbi:fez family zinc finger protein 2-like [Argiope bruennichi]|uniref:fez family zinc finger protein 2-like n=1 Tax=Argiope bruennichi TaxID=94029 RepID=UPI0024940292|nr:fez family zinc finger protein 2-like [Argiope bruennichi]